MSADLHRAGAFRGRFGQNSTQCANDHELCLELNRIRPIGMLTR